jgi:hypothetical protein
MFEISRRREEEKKIDRVSSVEASLTFGLDERVILGKLSAGAIMTVGHQPTPHPQIIASTPSSSMRFTSQVEIFNNHLPSPGNSTPAPEDNAKITPTTSTPSNESLTPFGEFVSQNTDDESGTIHVTTTPKDDEDEEQKREKHRNFLFSQILDAIDESLSISIREDLRRKIIEDLWEDFSSNQEYQSSITANAPGSIQQNSNPPMRDPLPLEKYTAKLAPKTYYGVGIQTELVKEADRPYFLKITQFYDDSPFESALCTVKSDDIKITAIYCKLNEKEEFYTIDEIFESCGQDEKVFNLKLCDIFRHPSQNNIKLKFSTKDPNSQEKELEIKKSIFKKDEQENSSYKNIKTIFGSQAPKSYLSPTSCSSTTQTEFVILG